jgi:hypothetical protein
MAAVLMAGCTIVKGSNGKTSALKGDKISCPGSAHDFIGPFEGSANKPPVLPKVI